MPCPIKSAGGSGWQIVYGLGLGRSRAPADRASRALIVGAILTSARGLLARL